MHPSIARASPSFILSSQLASASRASVHLHCPPARRLGLNVSLVRGDNGRLRMRKRHGAICAMRDGPDREPCRAGMSNRPTSMLHPNPEVIDANHCARAALLHSRTSIPTPPPLLTLDQSNVPQAVPASPREALGQWQGSSPVGVVASVGSGVVFADATQIRGGQLGTSLPGGLQLILCPGANGAARTGPLTPGNLPAAA